MFTFISLINYIIQKGYNLQSKTILINSDKFMTTIKNKLCRAICIHGISYAQIWRGPIRADRNLAQIDLDEHLSGCEITQDSSIIDEGDPGWE